MHMLTLFCIKTNLRENRLFAAEWTIDEQKRPHNVKYYTEKWTKQDRQMRRIWGPVKMKRAWKQIARKQNKVCHAAHLIIYRLDKPPMRGRKLLGKGH